MADTSNRLSWLPGFLIAAGGFFLVASLVSDGPDRVGGIVFGVLSLAAAGAILRRRAHDAARQPPPQGDAADAEQSR